MQRLVHGSTYSGLSLAWLGVIVQGIYSPLGLMPCFFGILEVKSFGFRGLDCRASLAMRHDTFLLMAGFLFEGCFVAANSLL